MTSSQPVVVLGMHRSGTLALAGLLSLSGVEFDRPVNGVRFGMMIKTLTGAELGGFVFTLRATTAGDVRPDIRHKVEFPFCCRLLPGSYFINAGVTGFLEGSEQFLHRIIDAAMFRVRSEPDLSQTGVIDFQADGSD